MAENGSKQQTDLPKNVLLGRSLQHTASQYFRVFAASAAARQARLSSFSALWKEAPPALLALWYLLYNSFARAVLTVLPCSQPVDGQEFVLADFNVACDTAAHRSAAAVSATCIVLLCLGTPAALAAALYKYRHELDSPFVFRTLGFLYDGFKRERGLYAWQATIMLRNFAVVAILTTVPTAQLQIMWSVLVVSIAAWAHLSMQPYAAALYNHVEGLSLMSTVGCVVMSLSLVTGLSVEERPSADFQAVIMWLLFVVQLAVLLLFAYFLAALGTKSSDPTGVDTSVSAWDKADSTGQAAEDGAAGVELTKVPASSVGRKIKRLSVSAMAQSSVLNTHLAKTQTKDTGPADKMRQDVQGRAAARKSMTLSPPKAPAALRAARVKSGRQDKARIQQ